MTHELRGRGIVGGKRGGGGQREKNWDNCNNINNKIYLEKNKTLYEPNKTNHY